MLLVGFEDFLTIAFYRDKEKHGINHKNLCFFVWYLISIFSTRIIIIKGSLLILIVIDGLESEDQGEERILWEKKWNIHWVGNRLEDFSNRLNLHRVKRRVAAFFFGWDDSPNPYLSSFWGSDGYVACVAIPIDQFSIQ